MVREALHRRLPEGLKPHFAIDTDSLERFEEVIKEQGGQSVDAIVRVGHVSSRRHIESVLTFKSVTPDRTIRFEKKGPVVSTADTQPGDYFVAAELTAMEMLFLISHRLGGIDTRLFAQNMSDRSQIAQLNPERIRDHAMSYGIRPLRLPDVQG